MVFLIGVQNIVKSFGADLCSFELHQMGLHPSRFRVQAGNAASFDGNLLCAHRIAYGHPQDTSSPDTSSGSLRGSQIQFRLQVTQRDLCVLDPFKLRLPGLIKPIGNLHVA
ncbi:hypothetical protein ACIQW9_08160 [Herminiimonas sp. NPDC097707]|uniref:hypothetical protein n=1 Tax=Herminiimonas sp. NPDC097707 TaxID=3364007 RepID=UPI00383BEB4A